METCDRCPQPARIKAIYDTGGYLLACLHHAREWWGADVDYPGVTFQMTWAA